MRRFAGFFLLICLLVLAGCQKELSTETSNNLSVGSLQSDVTGDCLPKIVSGVYEKQIPLDPLTNTIDVTVDVQSTGTYEIITDTVNGFYFTGKGIFTSTGVKTVTLKGEGTPLADGIANFTVKYGISECVVSVTVLPVGGSNPAVFTLAGAPGTCMGYQLGGSYIKDQTLTNASYVDIDVNVTTLGTYTISTGLSNGFSFAGSGSFVSTGPATVRLYASGKPAAVGSTTVPVTVGSSTCSFTVDVTSGADFTVDCASASINGTYTKGTALDGSNTVDIEVTVATIGGYVISGTVNGMTFSASGTFTSTGLNTITLDGSGTPVADGDFDVDIAWATGNCSFEVTVGPAGGGGSTAYPWKFTQGTKTFEGTMSDKASILTAGGFTFLDFQGTDNSGDYMIVIGIAKQGSSISTGTYVTNSISGNIASFLFVNTNTGSEDYKSDFPSGTNLSVVVTKYDVTNKIIEGTFSGTAKTPANATVQITAGSFKCELE